MTNTLQMKTTELTDLCLLWAFSRAIGREDPIYRRDTGEMAYIGSPDKMGPLKPDLNRLVESRRLHICPVLLNDVKAFEVWVDGLPRERTSAFGETAVVAAMRSVVRERLGDQVDVPEEVAQYSLEDAQAQGWAYPARAHERQR